MFDNFLLFTCGAVGLLHVVGMVVVRSTFRFSASVILLKFQSASCQNLWPVKSHHASSNSSNWVLP